MRHLRSLVLVTTLSALLAPAACDSSPGSLGTESADAGAADVLGDARPRKHPEIPLDVPEGPGCAPFPGAWSGLYPSDYSDGGTPFELTIEEAPLGEPDEFNPCTHQLEDPVALLTGHLGPPGLGSEVRGLRSETDLCFIIGESYGMRIFKGQIIPDRPCALSGTWAGHSGSYPWEAVAVPDQGP